MDSGFIAALDSAALFTGMGAVDFPDGEADAFGERNHRRRRAGRRLRNRIKTGGVVGGTALSEFEGVVEPEKTIYINGLEYIQIYRVADIPESVYQALLAKRAP